MRHSKTINHLGRKSLTQKSELANMAVSLIIHKEITTTTARQKPEKLISNRSKQNRKDEFNIPEE
jgi:large subunit ribosomal protein L17